MDGPGAITARDVAVFEANSVALGVGPDALMENAGRAVAEEAMRHLPPPPARVGILAGPGNNGGDGFAAAYYLGQWGYRTEIWLARPAAEIRTPTARRTFERIQSSSLLRETVPTPDDLAEYPLVIDALLGVGQAGPMRASVRAAAVAVRAAAAPVLSVDVPTGYEDPEGIRARWTVTFLAPKRGVPEDRIGAQVVAEIGMPEAAWKETGPGEFLRLGSGGLAGRSGRGPRVVIVGGGPYAGAPALTGLAALRAGAERATVIAPEQAAPMIQGFSPNLVVRGVGGSHLRPEYVARAVEWIRAGPVGAVVLGPGAGASDGTPAFFEGLLASLDPSVPVVVDADALRALRPAAESGSLRGRTVLATPNDGEFQRLLGAPGSEGEERIATVRALAEALGVTLLVKGAVDEISDGLRSARNRHHHPAMAVAGSGDVLDGILAALLAQGIGPFDAARLGTYWAGESALRAGAVHGTGIQATDLIDRLGEAGRLALERVRPPTP